MAFKQFALDESTTITIYKRKASRSLRLSIAADGGIRVSIPTWAPYQAGLTFAKSRQHWIAAQRQPVTVLKNGDKIGKAHHLRLEPSRARSITTRIYQSEIIVRYPETLVTTDPRVQTRASEACVRALRKEAEHLLPGRLEELASTNNFSFSKVTIKQLKSRWGSCDNQQAIVLNLYLMQLPWECIDYVLLHELTHTKIMKHGPEFWAAMRPLVPDLARIRKVMRGFQPVLSGATVSPMS